MVVLPRRRVAAAPRPYDVDIPRRRRPSKLLQDGRDDFGAALGIPDHLVEHGHELLVRALLIRLAAVYLAGPTAVSPRRGREEADRPSLGSRRRRGRTSSRSSIARVAAAPRQLQFVRPRRAGPIVDARAGAPRRLFKNAFRAACRACIPKNDIDAW